MHLSFRIFFAVTFLLPTSFSSYAQIDYQKTFQAALEKSRTEGKPIFLHLGLPQLLMGVKVLSMADRPEIADFYNKNFVNYVVSRDSPEFGSYIDRYQISSFPILIFMNSESQLIYKSPKPATSPKEYVDYGQDALDRLKSGKSLFVYEQKFMAGTLDKTQLKEYIKLRIQSGLHDNTQVLDRYIGLLTVAELDDYREVLFILKAGPIAFGKVHKLATTNQRLLDSIYRTEPVNDRIEMNGRIVTNSFNIAVRNKDYRMFDDLKTFITNIHQPNYNAGYEQVLLKSLAFYKAVNDTANFYSSAINYYDHYYMRQNVDSLRKIALKNRGDRDEMKMSMERSRALAKKKLKRTPQSASSVVRVVTTTVTITGTNSMTANALNTIAWDFYTMGTRNMNNLTKALRWSMRSLQIDPDPAYYDTLAHIFYRMGLVDEAVLNQNKAIALLMSTPELAQQLADARTEAAKMLARTL